MSIKLDTATRIDAPAGAPNANTDADNLRKDLEVVRGERDSARGEVKKEKERADKAEGERDSLKTKLDAASANSDQATIDARVAARIELQDSARSVLGKDFVFQGKSDREIRVAVITKHDPKFDATEKTDAYLEGAYLYASKTVQDEQQALSNVNETAVSDTTNADGKSSVVEDEKKKMAERNANAWRPKPKA
jgi:hypothetical protein